MLKRRSAQIERGLWTVVQNKIIAKVYQTYFACRVSAIKPEAIAAAAEVAPKSCTHPLLLSMLIYTLKKK